jgi:hypothetical protein
MAIKFSALAPLVAAATIAGTTAGEKAAPLGKRNFLHRRHGADRNFSRASGERLSRKPGGRIC